MARKEEKDYVENLDCSRGITSNFAVVNKIVRTASSGRTYLDFILSDKSGRISGRMFPTDNLELIYSSINTGSICKISGNINEFPPGSGKINIVINSIRELDDDEYELDDFIRTSGNDQEKLVKEIKNTIRKIENELFKNLLKSFFCDNKFTDLFYQAPAAMVHHHNYIGGLLDHTVEVLRISKRLCEIFPELDKDLLYTGILLHDVGKIKAYDYDLIQIQMSEQGKMIDHLFISADMVSKKMKDLQFPEELSNKILHLILSHHGEVSNGWGSLIDPKIPEAVALHYADNLDAKVKEIFQ